MPRVVVQEKRRFNQLALLLLAGKRAVWSHSRVKEWPMKIGSIISGKRVETISASASIHDLVSSLNSHHVGALVVSSDGKNIDGIVSERDVVRAMPGKLDQLIGMHVRDIMTVDVHTCTADSTVAELMTMMTELRIRHVPVVAADGALISIVSIGDVVKNHVNELDSERQALKDYVASGN